MAKSNPEVISLKGEPLLKEGVASSEISPGMLVEFGGAKDLQPQSTAGANCRRAIALENDLLGKGITDAYKAGERVRVGSFVPGQEVLVLLVEGGAAVTKGDALQADTNGLVDKHSDGKFVIGYALESIDNEDGDGSVFIKMEVN